MSAMATEPSGRLGQVSFDEDNAYCSAGDGLAVRDIPMATVLFSTEPTFRGTLPRTHLSSPLGPTSTATGAASNRIPLYDRVLDTTTTTTYSAGLSAGTHPQHRVQMKPESDFL